MKKYLSVIALILLLLVSCDSNNGPINPHPWNTVAGFTDDPPNLTEIAGMYKLTGMGYATVVYDEGSPDNSWNHWYNFNIRITEDEVFWHHGDEVDNIIYDNEILYLHEERVKNYAGDLYGVTCIAETWDYCLEIDPDIEEGVVGVFYGTKVFDHEFEFGENYITTVDISGDITKR